MSAEHFYRDTAKYYAASTILHGVDSIVMLENMNDEWFWRQILEHYRPGKYLFQAGTRTNNTTTITTGCKECLKFKGFLSQRFFVCMDSDFRYLLNESIQASEGYVQTYTYSWENHCVHVNRFNTENKYFDFALFLQKYSVVVHKGLMLLLFQLKNGLNTFAEKHFKSILAQQYKKGDELDAGTNLVHRIATEIDNALKSTSEFTESDYDSLTTEYMLLGLNKNNAYLYVRGHNVYNTLKSIGKKVYERTGKNFENDVLLAPLSFDSYPEWDKISNDIKQLGNLPKLKVSLLGFLKD